MQANSSILVICAALLSGSSVYAQQLTLFEAMESPANNGPQLAQPDQLGGNTDAAPRFSLRSISRFGDSYVGVIVDAAGNAVEARWSNGQQVPLQGYPGYAVVAMESGQLTLQQPGGVPCVPQETAGVRCSDQLTLLSLATLSPLATNGGQVLPGSDPDMDAAVMGPQPGEENIVVGPDGNPVFVNPFAAAVMEAQGEDAEQSGRTERARARAERLQQFQVERIPEDQVPPGMRLVRTPFGDRLVPVRQ